MIGVRVTCDAPGCGRHFEADAIRGPVADQDEVLACRHTSSQGAPSVYLVGDVVLPSGWAVVNRDCGGEGVQLPGERARVRDLLTETFCADHAPQE